MKKQKIKKYAGAVLLTVALLGVGVRVYDATIQHYFEWCPLNHIFGLKHQVNKINKGDHNFRYEARYVPEDIFEKIPAGYTDYCVNCTVNVIEYVNYYRDGFRHLKNNATYAVDSGFLVENAIPFGEERIEVYDHIDSYDEPKLIRIFKKRGS